MFDVLLIVDCWLLIVRWEGDNHANHFWIVWNCLWQVLYYHYCWSSMKMIFTIMEVIADTNVNQAYQEEVTKKLLQRWVGGWMRGVTCRRKPVYRALTGWERCRLDKHFPFTQNFHFPFQLIFQNHVLQTIYQRFDLHLIFVMKLYSQFDVSCNKDVVHENVQFRPFFLEPAATSRLQQI